MREKSGGARAVLMTTDVAKILDVSADRVRQMAREGTIRCETTPGGVRIYDPQEVERILTLRQRRAHRGQQKAAIGAGI